MSGVGQFGDMEMGGMFSSLKIRPGLAKGDYKDPGPYRNPPGTLAYEWKGAPPPAPAKAGQPAAEHAEFRVVDPRRSHQAMNHD